MHSSLPSLFSLVSHSIVIVHSLSSLCSLSLSILPVLISILSIFLVHHFCLHLFSLYPSSTLYLIHYVIPVSIPYSLSLSTLLSILYSPYFPLYSFSLRPFSFSLLPLFPLSSSSSFRRIYWFTKNSGAFQDDWSGILNKPLYFAHHFPFFICIFFFVPPDPLILLPQFSLLHVMILSLPLPLSVVTMSLKFRSLPLFCFSFFLLSE